MTNNFLPEHTTINAMRAMALALLPTMQWRHHGIGCLQGYIVEDSDPEVRLHIWSRDLIKPGMEESGDVHDHRFDLVSHVLAGTVWHEELIPTPDENGDWGMLALTHARAAKDSAYHGPTTPLEGRFKVQRKSWGTPAGESYAFPAGRFHRSPVVDLAVSVIEKHNQTDAQARILYPLAKPPVMAFGHEMDWSVINPVLDEARKALAGRLP